MSAQRPLNLLVAVRTLLSIAGANIFNVEKIHNFC